MKLIIKKEKPIKQFISLEETLSKWKENTFLFEMIFGTFKMYEMFIRDINLLTAKKQEDYKGKLIKYYKKEKYENKKQKNNRIKKLR